MHDPSTVAFEIKYPWRKYRNRTDHLLSDYREPFITFWHEDPELDGSDDSCGWSYPKVTREAEWVKSLGNDLKSVCRDDPLGLRVQRHAEGSPMWWVLWLHRASFWHRRHPLSMRHVNKFLYGQSYPGNRDEVIYEDDHERHAWIIARIYLQLIRPWYKHPRWHFWHWRFQIHPWQKIRRFLLTRCCKCGKGFKYGDSVCTDQWNSPRPKFLRGETGVYHGDCRTRSSGIAQAAYPPPRPRVQG